MLHSKYYGDLCASERRTALLDHIDVRRAVHEDHGPGGIEFPGTFGAAEGRRRNHRDGGITADSRQVKPGDLFVAVAGSKADGAAYIAGCAVSRSLGGRAGKGAQAEAGAPSLRSPNRAGSLAKAASSFYERQPETMVAVTGTAGKTSVASFTRQIWAHSGFSAAMIRHPREWCGPAAPNTARDDPRPGIPA